MSLIEDIFLTENTIVNLATSLFQYKELFIHLFVEPILLYVAFNISEHDKSILHRLKFLQKEQKRKK